MNIAMTCETICECDYLGYAPNLNSSRCVAFGNTRAVANKQLWEYDIIKLISNYGNIMIYYSLSLII